MNNLRSSPFSLKQRFSVFMVLTIVLMLIPFLVSKKLNDSRSGYFQIPVYQHGAVTRIVPQAPLEEPLFSDVEVKDFLSESMHQTLTLSFDDYKTLMMEGKKKYFIDSGWKSFAKSLADSASYSSIFTNKEVIELVPSRVPFLLFSDKVKGETDTYYMWRLTFFGTIFKKSFRDNGKRSPYAKVVFDVDIQRVPRGNGSGAIKIVKVSPWSVKLMKRGR